MYGIDKGLHRPEGQNRKFRKIKIISNIFSNYDKIAVEINKKKQLKKTNTGSQTICY